MREFVCFIVLVSCISLFLLVCYFVSDDPGSNFTVKDNYDPNSMEDCSDPNNIPFVVIPAGSFRMGDNFKDGDPDELPVHTVSLSGFEISKYETTNAQYCQYLNAALDSGDISIHGSQVYGKTGPYKGRIYYDMIDFDIAHILYNDKEFIVRRMSDKNIPNKPVVNVSWYGAKAFCDFFGYHLPTEAQWEYAARGGKTDNRFPWGNNINHDHANYQAWGDYLSYDTSLYGKAASHPSYNSQIPYTAPVGSFAANGYGLHDTSGNVWEWCSDWYNENYYKNSPRQDPQGPANGTYHIIRGGSWGNIASSCRNSTRSIMLPYKAYNYATGFRCVRKLN